MTRHTTVVHKTPTRRRSHQRRRSIRAGAFGWRVNCFARSRRGHARGVAWRSLFDARQSPSRSPGRAVAGPAGATLEVVAEADGVSPGLRPRVEHASRPLLRGNAPRQLQVQSSKCKVQSERRRPTPDVKRAAHSGFLRTLHFDLCTLNFRYSSLSATMGSLSRKARPRTSGTPTVSKYRGDTIWL